jgi:hypothetical protein
MAESKAKKRDDAPEGMKTEFTETTVPINVGMGKDEMAKAETQNRQVGVDDSKEVRDTLHDAAEKSVETVDLPVKHPVGSALPEAARKAIADQDKDEPEALQYDPNDRGVHSVTLDGKTYTWKDGEESSVPKEAIEVYRRYMESNSF